MPCGFRIELRREIDPNQLAELESTRELMNFRQRQVNSVTWNLEDGTIEDKNTMVDLVNKPHETVLRLLGAGSSDLSKAMQFPYRIYKITNALEQES
jgi:1,2-phenylacetyl-CoA epoxidase catalytic subunit